MTLTQPRPTCLLCHTFTCFKYCLFVRWDEAFLLAAFLIVGKRFTMEMCAKVLLTVKRDHDVRE